MHIERGYFLMNTNKIISKILIVPMLTSVIWGFHPFTIQKVKAADLASISNNQTLTPPKNLKIPTLAYDDKSITLVWNKPDNYTNIADYNIYMNGKLIGKASENNASPAKALIDKFYGDSSNNAATKISSHSYIVTGLTPSTAYTFTVRSVDSNGKESTDSNSVSQSTTAVPEVFDVTKYGAVGDGTTLDTKAIQLAIDACITGGKVLIPAGKTFKTGSIWLKGDMTFEVDGTLLGSENPDDYPYPDQTYKTVVKTTALINSGDENNKNTKNIRIVGTGTIDGNGWKHAATPTNADGLPNYIGSNNTKVINDGILAAAQTKKAVDKYGFSQADAYTTRSNLIDMFNITNLYYGDGLSVINPSQHTITNANCNNVVANALKIATYDCNNGDGIGLAPGSGLTIINSIIDTGDDSVGFNAGRGAVSDNLPAVSDIWVYNNYFGRGHGAIVGGSYTGSWIQDILAEDNVINGEGAALRLKTSTGNGGGAKNILFRDNAIKNITDGGKQPFVFTSGYTASNKILFEPSLRVPQFKDITIKNCTVDTAGSNAIYALGLNMDGGYHQNINFENVSFKNVKNTKMQYMKNSSFKNVTFSNVSYEKGVTDFWNIKDSSGLTFDSNTTSTPLSTDASSTPTWPANSSLTAGAITDTGLTLTWSKASDNVEVKNYNILNGTKVIATVAGNVNSYNIIGLSPALSYKFKVEAIDATGNLTTNGPSASITTTGTKDTIAPTAPSASPSVSLSNVGGNIGSTWVSLSWEKATDNYGVSQYEIYANNKLIGKVDESKDALSYIAGSLSPNTAYNFQLKAIDAAGNGTMYGESLKATTLAQTEKTTPVWPSGSAISVSNITGDSVKLSWNAAKDDEGIVGYRLFENGAAVKPDKAQVFTQIDTNSTTKDTSYTISGLKPDTTYTFKVESTDKNANWTDLGPSITLTIADRTALNSAISSAQAKLDAAVEGTDVGQYPAGTKKSLQDSINAAQAINNKLTSNSANINQAVMDINTAVKTFDAAKITEKKTEPAPASNSNNNKDTSTNVQATSQKTTNTSTLPKTGSPIDTTVLVTLGALIILAGISVLALKKKKLQNQAK